MHSNFEEILALIYNSRGNISPQKFKKQYFIKQNKEYLWEWFEKQTLNFPNYTKREIVLLLRNGFDKPPKCIVCGNNAKIQMYTSNYTFDYCSKECSHKSHKRKEKISQTKQAYSVGKKIEIESKRKNTNLEKYGVEYQSKRQEIKEIISEKLSKHQIGNVRDILLNREWLNEEYNIKKRSASDIADELEVYYGTIISYCRKYGFKIRKQSKGSLPQKQIYEYIKTIYFGEVLYDDWDILGNLELDIYIPELKLAFEHNGLPSHSANCINKKTPLRHITKTNRCKELGITLFHIRGDQWIKQKEIIKSMIASKFNKTTRIFARNCSIKELSTKEAKNFFRETHIQGYTNSTIKLGLFFGEELVASILFSKPRYNKRYSWELIRYSNKLYHTVVGGFSKLLKWFRKYYSGNIISYCDNSRSNGNVYIQNGFRKLSETKIGYFWTDNHTVYNRLKFQKHKLKTVLNKFDTTKTEHQNMFENGYRIYYDCGQMVFILE